MKYVLAKRLAILSIGCAAGLVAYTRLRNHATLANRVTQLEHLGQRLADKAGNAAQVAKAQAADVAGSATTGAHDVLDGTTARAREMLDATKNLARQAVTPIRDRIDAVRADAPEAPDS